MDSKTSHVSLFMPARLRAELERSARESDRSLSAEIRVRLVATTSDPSVAAPSPSSGVAGAAEGKEYSSAAGLVEVHVGSRVWQTVSV